MTVNATDADAGDNGLLKYSILNLVQGFSIDENTGVLRVNQSNISSPIQDFQITIKATDSGKPPLYALTSVRIKVNNGVGGSTKRNDKDYK